jgi:mRNA interferase HigB
MRVISISRLRKFWRRYADSEQPLQTWYQMVSRGQWKNLVELRKTFPTADSVSGLTVFNIKGNAYRLIAKVDYERQTVYIHEPLTHTEYSKGRWKRG